MPLTHSASIEKEEKKMTEKEDKKAGAPDGDAATTAAAAAPAPPPVMEGEEFDLFEEFELPGGACVPGEFFFLRERAHWKGRARRPQGRALCQDGAPARPGRGADWSGSLPHGSATHKKEHAWWRGAHTHARRRHLSARCGPALSLTLYALPPPFCFSFCRPPQGRSRNGGRRRGPAPVGGGVGGRGRLRLCGPPEDGAGGAGVISPGRARARALDCAFSLPLSLSGPRPAGRPLPLFLARRAV